MSELNKLTELTFALGRCDFSSLSVGDKAIIGALLERAHELQDQYNNRTPTEWAYAQACTALEKHRERADKAEAERDALANENLTLKAVIEKYTRVKHDFDAFDGDRRGIAVSLCEAEDALVDSIKTPATDAYANQLRAEGAASVGTLIRASSYEFPDSAEDIVEECAMIADNRAINLCKENNNG